MSEKKTVDLLIKNLDEYALMDLMDIIQQYQLTYSINGDEATSRDNDFRFQDIMKRIVQNNTILTESMQPMVEEYTERISDYTLETRTTKKSKTIDEYEKLLDKCNEIKYIK